MQQYCRSEENNYIRLSQQAGSIGSTNAGPQPYHRSLPANDVASPKHKSAPAITLISPNMSTPSAGSSNGTITARQYNYPEVKPLAYSTNHAQQQPQPLIVPAAMPTPPAYIPAPQVNSPLANQPMYYYTTAHQMATALPPSNWAQSPGGIPQPPPLPAATQPVAQLVQSSRPGYYRMPKYSRPFQPQRPLSGNTHMLLQNSPSTYPFVTAAQQSQSAPISPASPHGQTMFKKHHEPYAINTQVASLQPHPLQQQQPLSAPVHPQQTLHKKQSFAQPQGSQMTAAAPLPNNAGVPPAPQTKWAKPPAANAYKNTGRVQTVYLRNWERQCERSKFTTQFHCLEPVKLVSKNEMPKVPQQKGNLHPLFKASEDWIAPSVGLPLDNKPGYRCVLYIVDGTLLYDNGLGSEKLFSKGTLLMTTTNHEVSIYVRNPSKTHRAHIIRLWIDIDDFTPSNSRKNSHSNNTGAQQGIAVEPNRQQRSKKQGMTGIMHADFHSKVRHVADSDKENCLLVLAQPNNYYPSYGMTSIIYGPVKHTRRSDSDQADDRASDINKAERRDGIASLLGASYYHSKSALFTRPDYFTPDSMMDLTESIEAEDKDWEETDPQLSSRVCADPLLVDEDIFVSLCSLESGSKVIYEPYDLHDHERVSMRKRQNLQRATRRRVWIQTILADLNTEARSNGGRLIINGDRANRMRPGDSAYVRRIELTDKIVLENCGKTPIEFIVAETPY